MGPRDAKCPECGGKLEWYGEFTVACEDCGWSGSPGLIGLDDEED